jgi:hypothetical protein
VEESLSSTGPGYRYDVFISYRRANIWPQFVTQHFLPIFSHWLGAEMGSGPVVFFGEDVIELGDQWPLRLASSLAASKVMVCLWSNEYFRSPWCMAELSHMLARMELTKTGLERPRLIFGAVIHGDPPEALGNIERVDIRAYSNPWMAINSPLAERLSDSLRKLAASVARAIEQAPEYDPSWTKLPLDGFMQAFSPEQHHGAPPNL